ncbi:MAG: carbohydrate ABC transporter permease [Chloroflexi bacterium]|nr:carbohydrate ABC transporter permease [Chloroflexota bacterium]MBU1752134.1 carbohydrate ABC transporter permease [Chloroflexota bacterium]
MKMSRLTRPSLYFVLIAASIVYLIPVYVLLVTGLKSFTEVNLDTMWNLPASFSLQSFVQAWVGDPSKGVIGLSGNFMNSLMLVIPATIISALLGSMNGYVLSKWRFRGSELLFTLFLFGMFIPYQSILIPLVQTLQTMGLYGSIPGLILVHVIYGIPITTLIFRNYYATVPHELVEAGRIDGAGFFGIYRHILFPISLPGFVVVMIWEFQAVWNDFLFAVIITNKPAVQPVTVALNNLAGSFVVEWNVQMAGALLAALPTLLVYILMGRYFMRGLLAGSVKG